MSIQLKGNLKLGPNPGAAVEFGANITEFTLNTDRKGVEIPATLATGKATTAAGEMTQSVTISFFSSTAATSVWAELYDAIITDSAELYFEGTQNPGAVTGDNPKWSGYITILTLKTGVQVGMLRTQSQTYPVTAAGITRAIA